MCGAQYTTGLLGEDVPARFLRLKDRGELREGHQADICVIDLDNLEVLPSEIRSDVPGATTRLLAGIADTRLSLSTATRP
jgi:N-acyl-D-aspartate/D-glutamate deacylase